MTFGLLEELFLEEHAATELEAAAATAYARRDYLVALDLSSSARAARAYVAELEALTTANERTDER